MLACLLSFMGYILYLHFKYCPLSCPPTPEHPISHLVSTCSPINSLLLPSPVIPLHCGIEPFQDQVPLLPLVSNKEKVFFYFLVFRQTKSCMRSSNNRFTKPESEYCDLSSQCFQERKTHAWVEFISGHWHSFDHSIFSPVLGLFSFLYELRHLTFRVPLLFLWIWWVAFL